MVGKALAASGLCLFVLSCGTKEGPVAPWLGSGPGQGSEPFVVTTEPADAETTFLQTVSLGSGSVLFVGRAGGYEARSLVRFPLPDTVVSGYGPSRLMVTLQPSQTPSPVRFRLFRVGQFWNETVVTWERANTDSTGDVAWGAPGGVIAPVAIADAGPCSLQADTVRVTFELSAAATAQIYGAHAADCGFMLTLEDEGLTHELWRFYSRENAVTLRPQWEVSFTDTAGVDTSRVLYAAADAAIVRRVAPSDTAMLVVGSGVGYRSLIRFPLPQVLDSTVTINAATLYLYHDTARAFLETKTVQVDLVDSAWNGDLTSLTASYVSQSLVVPGTSAISFNVSRAVKAWVTGASENHGLRLRFSGEDNAVAYCAMYPSTAPDDLRPRLEIAYTLPPTPPGGYAPPLPASRREKAAS